MTLTYRADPYRGFRPDDVLMHEGEIRNLSFDYRMASADVATFTIEHDNLTFGTPAIDGTTASITVTADNVGHHDAIATITNAAGETIKGDVRFTVGGECRSDYL